MAQSRLEELRKSSEEAFEWKAAKLQAEANSDEVEHALLTLRSRYIRLQAAFAELQKRLAGTVRGGNNPRQQGPRSAGGSLSASRTLMLTPCDSNPAELRGALAKAAALAPQHSRRSLPSITSASAAFADTTENDVLVKMGYVIAGSERPSEAHQARQTEAVVEAVLKHRKSTQQVKPKSCINL